MGIRGHILELDPTRTGSYLLRYLINTNDSFDSFPLKVLNRDLSHGEILAGRPVAWHVKNVRYGDTYSEKSD